MKAARKRAKRTTSQQQRYETYATTHFDAWHDDAQSLTHVDQVLERAKPALGAFFVAYRMLFKSKGQFMDFADDVMAKDNEVANEVLNGATDAIELFEQSATVLKVFLARLMVAGCAVDKWPRGSAMRSQMTTDDVPAKGAPAT